ncbi:MAG: hypothetical protein K2J32_13700 [Ruminococcus sp.]|nr:hypothetical protein [Ruminococcus sp.]
MKRQIICEDMIVNEKQIVCRYSVNGDELLNSILVAPREFCAIFDEEISEVPIGILMIPFVSELLPLIWILDAELIINEIDQSFYESISEFKKGYMRMYPDIDFKGTLTPGRVVANAHSTERKAVLFSGGVDAFTTLISHIDEKPDLITLWGADVDFGNEDGWKEVKKQVKETANNFSLHYHIVRTNFRKLIDPVKMRAYMDTINPKYEWWHDFQHGIGIISHAAPLAYQLGIGTVYIASSFTAADGHYTCASDPTIDNHVKFGSANVVHDGYDLNRQMKIHKLCEFSDYFSSNVPIRVCWKSTGGRNCCHCEKCYRTMMGILAEGKDPKKLGFDLYNQENRKHMLRSLRYNLIAKHHFRRYRYIRDALRSNYTLETCPKDLKWFYQLQITENIQWYEKVYLKIIAKIRKLVK